MNRTRGVEKNNFPESWNRMLPRLTEKEEKSATEGEPEEYPETLSIFCCGKGEGGGGCRSWNR